MVTVKRLTLNFLVETARSLLRFKHSSLKYVPELQTGKHKSTNTLQIKQTGI